MSGQSLAPPPRRPAGTGPMRRDELRVGGPASAQAAAAGKFYNPANPTPPAAPRAPLPSRSQRILGPKDPEPDGPKLVLMAHGGIPDQKVVRDNSQLASLTVPQHFRIVYFFDPLKEQSLTTWSCPAEAGNWCMNASKVQRWVYSGGKNPEGITYAGRFPVVSFEADGALGLFACPDDRETEMIKWGIRTLKDEKEKLKDRFTRGRAERVKKATMNLERLAREATRQEKSWSVEDSMSLTEVLKITSDQFKDNVEDAAAMDALDGKEITIYIVSCSIKEEVRELRRVDFRTEDEMGLTVHGGGVRRSRRRARARTRSARTRSARTRSARTRRSHS